MKETKSVKEAMRQAWGSWAIGTLFLPGIYAALWSVGKSDMSMWWFYALCVVWFICGGVLLVLSLKWRE